MKIKTGFAVAAAAATSTFAPNAQAADLPAKGPMITKAPVAAGMSQSV
jgi:hypothetical protein